jgi:acyl carrier protein
MDSGSEAFSAALTDKLIALVDALVGEVRAGHRPRVTLDSALERDLGLDSLTRVELLARVERAFDVRLPEDALETALTPRDLAAALQRAGPGPSGEASAGPAADDARQAPPRHADGFPESAGDLPEVLAWHAARHPERCHVTFYRTPEATESLTYGELAAAAATIGAALARIGIAPGQRVALMLPSGLDFFRCFFGILHAGAIPVPMYPPARATQIEDHLRRQAGILRNCEATLLIAFEEIRPLARMLTGLAPTLSRIVLPADLDVAAGAAPDADVPVAPQRGELALLQYTSGSTGDPKGVALSHANLLANVRGFGHALEVSSTDVCVSWLPLYHDMGLIGAWLGSLYHACPLILMSPLDFLARPERWLWAIHRHRGTVTAAPNFAFELCLKRHGEMELAGLDLSSWRIALNGAEPVSGETLDGFAAAFGSHGLRREALAPVYGLAECSLALTVPPPGRAPRVERVEREAFMTRGRAEPVPGGERATLRFVSCGSPLPGHALRVVDGGGRPLPERRVGRLEFRGPSVTEGYYRNPEATRALFHDGWADSGDFAFVADGELYVTGRGKDMIIRGGRNFYPYELEQAVGELPGVRKGCVAAFGAAEPGGTSEQLVVVAETRETDAPARAALEQKIVAQASDVLGVPPDVVLLVPPHAVLKTSSGKIRRAAIRERYRRGTLGAGQRAAWLQVARIAGASALGHLRHALQSIPRAVYGVWVWSWIGVLSALAGLAILLLPTLAWRWRACRSLARLLGRVSGSRLAVQGVANLPNAPCVLVSNHASYIDGFVLAAALPTPVAFVGKAELRRSAVMRVLFERMAARFVERFEARKSVADARELAEAAGGWPPLLFFPEGTFVPEPGLRAFHLGAFQVAAQARLPVVPVALSGTRDILQPGSWWPRRGCLAVTICAPVAPQGEGWHGVLALRDEVRGAILAHCREPARDGS